MSRNVDIIIPIYNALEDLKVCIESLYKNTDLINNRLILINDCSSDVNVKIYLDQQESLNENIVVINNESNKGFSYNINLGMSQSIDRDVILLNSDTIVTKDWVEKIVACAYSDCSIGTVTPLSNNATLCSVPNFCEENSLPEGMTIEQVAQIVEECSLKKYPRITVAHGFCMFIKREVINLIGNFDAETFGRGYGEENDFCNRAEQMGYIHVMCDDTYIYHSGTKSFVSKEKEQYIKEHDQILNNRYPQQMQNNAMHCQNNPNGWVGKNIGYHLDIWNGKKNILYLLQSDFKEGADDNVGGTQLHVKHLTMGLRNDMNVFVAARDLEYLQVTAYTGEKEHTFRFYIGEKESFPLLRNRELAEIFRSILIEFRIDLVHVHHTATTSLDIYYEADKLGIPIIYTAHDFYYICPNEKLLDYEGNVCIEKSKKNCNECLNKKKNFYNKNNYIDMWHKHHEKVFELCKLIITPTKSAKEILCKLYPICNDKIEVIEHGMDKIETILDGKKIIYTDSLNWEIEKINNKGKGTHIVGVAYLTDEEHIQRKVLLKITDSSNEEIIIPTNFDIDNGIVQDDNRFYAYIPNTIIDKKIELKVNVILVKEGMYFENVKATKKIDKLHNIKTNKLKVAFIGGINEEKGGKIIYQIIKKGPIDVDWYILGKIGEKKLKELKKENLVKMGCYHSEDISMYLNLHKIDLVCILSKWPETFSYTLSEAWINNIPTIVTDIGALGQRIKDTECGWLVSSDEKQASIEVIERINYLKENREEYQVVYDRLKNYNHKKIICMNQEYKELYQMICDQNIVDKKINTLSTNEKMHISSAYTKGVSCYFGDDVLLLKIREMESQMKRINNNATIKVMLKITEKEFPLKKQIKKLIMKYMK